MLISELSKRTGIPIPTIRYYESYGLIRGESREDVRTNNYKYYDERIVEKLELIKGAKEAGFTLAEIKKLIDSWYNKRLSKEKKLMVIQGKICEIEEKIEQLKAVRKLLLDCIEEVESGRC